MSRGQQMLMLSLNKNVKADMKQVKQPVNKRLQPVSDIFHSYSAKRLRTEPEKAPADSNLCQSPSSHRCSSFGKTGTALQNDHYLMTSTPDVMTSTSQPMAKKKRPRTSVTQTEESKAKHPLMSPCSSCKRKCYGKLSETRRVDIYEQYWNKTYESRRQWMYSQIDRLPVYRRRAINNSRKPRGSSYLYKLPDEHGTDVFVCKQFFLHTPGYRSDKVITCLMQNHNSNFL